MHEGLDSYKEYLRLRHATDPSLQERRLELKADIARLVSLGDAKWYLQRLSQTVFLGPDLTYGEMASNIPDNRVQIPSQRAEPSLAQAVLGTKELLADYEHIKPMLFTGSKALVRVGSTSWAMNYDVRRNVLDPSDLDIEVLYDPDCFDTNQLSGICGLQEAVLKFGELYTQDKADYLAFGWKHNGRPISAHFMPTKIFEANCGKDYFTNPVDISLREFRTQPKSKPPTYYQRDGMGEIHKIYCSPENIGDGQITRTPLMAVGAQGQLVMGLVMDKYFTFPIADGDTSYFESYVLKFKKGLANHMQSTGGRFSNLPSRRDRMPYWLLEKLDAEQLALCQNS